jgi:hypothetical protein
MWPPTRSISKWSSTDAGRFEIAIEQVDPVATDLEPGAAVDHAAPLSGFSYVTGVAELADGIGVDPASIVETISQSLSGRHAMRGTR